MRKFNYEARDTTSSKIVKATVQAESESQAAKLLMAQGFTPLNITEEDGSKSFLSKVSGRISTKDKVVFTRQLATLLAAGLPLSQSMRTLYDQTENKQLKSIIEDLIISIEGGHSLYESFSKHPMVFDKLFLAIVASGEASGTLEESLQRIANQQEKDAAIIRKIRGALTYPVIVLFVIAGVLVFMLFTVVPQVQKLYRDLHKSLPFITQLIVDFSQFLINYWAVVLILLGLSLYVFMQFTRTPSGSRFLDALRLNMPIVKGMYRRLYMARFTRVGETLLDSGVSMLDTLMITSEAVNNSLVADEIIAATEKVRGGKDLSTALTDTDYFPELVPQMIKIGEKSGRTAEMMGKTAMIYEDELDQEIATISTSIEPILMVVLAIVSGGMVAAILLPIYGLVNTINI